MRLKANFTNTTQKDIATKSDSSKIDICSSP
jgi:hypothetical protein